jgi:hypothetical protein
MTYWFQQVAANPIGTSVYLISLATVAALLLYGSLIVRAWFKKLLEQASFSVPHHIGISPTGRSVSPSVYVIELGRSLVVGYYATDIKDAEQVCKGVGFAKVYKAWSLKMFRFGTEKLRLLRGKQMQVRACGS